MEGWYAEARVLGIHGFRIYRMLIQTRFQWVQLFRMVLIDTFSKMKDRGREKIISYRIIQL